ncbi:MAG: hypothetical protein H6Q63_789 [Firmicutes bacterium]|nr:hypothetical protein [Bacillota bacterium]
MAGQGQCPQGCCTGNEILCISIPCPISIVLLGISLQLELPCVRLTSQQVLTGTQAAQSVNALTGIIGAVGTILPTV